MVHIQEVMWQFLSLILQVSAFSNAQLVTCPIRIPTDRARFRVARYNPNIGIANNSLATTTFHALQDAYTFLPFLGMDMNDHPNKHIREAVDYALTRGSHW